MIVKTDKGSVEGAIEEGIHVFKGIPYAAPPLVELRWHPPQPAAAWEGVRQAKTFAKACPQPVYEESLDGSEPVGEQSEDCLYLNVWTPNTQPSKPMPVMVWIHGGAFKIGASHITMFSGLPLAQKGAVVVNFNYRLGNLGFFAHPALEAKHPNGPVNFGLLDQIAALEWVQRNIAAFGGDPDNVTLFGQSAGGVSVLALFASPLAQGLFHKGIAQSPYAIPEATRERALAVGTRVATELFKVSPHITAEELRKVPVAHFSAANLPDPGPDGKPVPVPGLAPMPAVDGVVLTQSIRDAFQAGDQKALPLIIGSTSNEASVLAAFGMDAGKVMTKMIEEGGEELADGLDSLKSLYKSDPEVQPGDLDDVDRFGSLVLRDLLFTMQARWISDYQSKKSSSWRYYFNYVTEADRPNHPHGVAHGNEVIHTLGTGKIFVGSKDTFTANDQAVSDKVTAYWFSFASNGIPTGSKAWTKHEFESSTALLPRKDKTLKLNDTLELQDNFRRVRLNAFIQLYPQLEAALAAQQA